MQYYTTVVVDATDRDQTPHLGCWGALLPPLLAPSLLNLDCSLPQADKTGGDGSSIKPGHFIQ
jgi:hypothetical protein